MVVLFSVLVAGDAAGTTVSVRCSHAAKSAALAKMQMYFFMVGFVWSARTDKAEIACRWQIGPVGRDFATLAKKQAGAFAPLVRTALGI